MPTFGFKSGLKGVGIDLVEIARASRFVLLHHKKLETFLTPSEYRLFSKSKSKVECFALLFAAKEAASKALGITLTHPGLFRHFRISLGENRLKVRFSGMGKYPASRKIQLLPFSLRDSVGVMAFAY